MMHSKHKLLKIQSAWSYRAHDAELCKLRTLIVDILPPVSCPHVPLCLVCIPIHLKWFSKRARHLYSLLQPIKYWYSVFFFWDEFSKWGRYTSFSHFYYGISSLLCPQSTPASAVRTSRLMHSGLANMCYH